MKREICCNSCGDSWRKTGEKYPEETVKIARGKALQPFMCDGCGANLNEGDLACAVSVLAAGQRMTMPGWENEYLARGLE